MLSVIEVLSTICLKKFRMCLYRIIHPENCTHNYSHNNKHDYDYGHAERIKYKEELYFRGFLVLFVRDQLHVIPTLSIGIHKRLSGL